MQVSNEEAIIATAVTCIIAAIVAAYILNSVVFQIIFSFVAGSLSTYVIQRRLSIQAEERKSKREFNRLMRDNFYGPIYERLGKVAVNVKAFRDPKEDLDACNNKGVSGLTCSYLFLLSKQPLKERIENIKKLVSEYDVLLGKAEAIICDVTSSALRREAPEVPRFNSAKIRFILAKSGKPIKEVTLNEAVLNKNNPFVSLQEQGLDDSCKIEVAIPETKGIDSARMKAYLSSY